MIAIDILTMPLLVASLLSLTVGFSFTSYNYLARFMLLIYLYKNKPKRFAEITHSDSLFMLLYSNPFRIDENLWKYVKSPTDINNENIAKYKRRLLLSSKIAVISLIIFILILMLAVAISTISFTYSRGAFK